MKALRSRLFRHVLVPITALSLLSACIDWKVQEIAPSQAVSEKEPSRVRLTMLDGSRVLIGDPVVTNGEIVGHRVLDGHQLYRAIESDTLRVAADSVARIEIQETDSTKTVIAMLFGVAALAGAVVLVMIGQMDGPFGGCCG